jgi:hypothetical protein
MKCIRPDKGCAILQDIHAGICGSHAGGRALVGKTYRQGFFWPTAMSDDDSLVCRCEGCQFFTHQKRVVSSTTYHTYYLAFLHMGAGFGTSFQES